MALTGFRLPNGKSVNENAPKWIQKLAFDFEMAKMTFSAERLRNLASARLSLIVISLLFPG